MTFELGRVRVLLSVRYPAVAMAIGEDVMVFLYAYERCTIINGKMLSFSEM